MPRVDSLRERSTERFRPTAGRVVGVCYAGVLVLAAGLTAWRGDSPAAAAATAGMVEALLVVHAMFLRPVLVAHDDHLLLRNMLSDTAVPWHRLDDVVVRRHTTKVFVGDGVHYGTGSGRWRREQVATSRPPLEARLLDLARSRAALSRERYPTGGVVRRVALPEVVALALGAGVFLVLLLLA